MALAFQLDHLQPFEPIWLSRFSNFFTFILGSQFLLPQKANYEKREFSQLQPSNDFRICSVLHGQKMGRGFVAVVRITSLSSLLRPFACSKPNHNRYVPFRSLPHTLKGPLINDLSPIFRTFSPPVGCISFYQTSEK